MEPRRDDEDPEFDVSTAVGEGEWFTYIRPRHSTRADQTWMFMEAGTVHRVREQWGGSDWFLRAPISELPPEAMFGWLMLDSMVGCVRSLPRDEAMLRLVLQEIHVHHDEFDDLYAAVEARYAPLFVRHGFEILARSPMGPDDTLMRWRKSTGFA
jgi:hypothetical protein